MAPVGAVATCLGATRSRGLTASRTAPRASWCPRLPSSLTIFKHNFLENGAALSEDNWLRGESLSCVRATECLCPPPDPIHRGCLDSHVSASEVTAHGPRRVYAWLQVGQVTRDFRMSPAALRAAASTAEFFLPTPGSLPQVLDLLPPFTQPPPSPVPLSPCPRCRSTVKADTGSADRAMPSE